MKKDILNVDSTYFTCSFDIAKKSIKIANLNFLTTKRVLGRSTLTKDILTKNIQLI